MSEERTRLAWRRTVLAATVVALLAARYAADRHQPLAVAGTALVWLVLLIAAQMRIRRMRTPGPTALDVTLPLVTAAAITALALLGIATATL